jgi:predicted transcriptional regulator
MKTSITVRLDKDLSNRLSSESLATKRGKSEIICEALRRQLTVPAFEQLHRRATPFAVARGYLNDEDVFRDVS